MAKGQKKKAYEKPRIIYQKKVEVLAAVCDSSFDGFENCQTAGPCPSRPFTAS